MSNNLCPVESIMTVPDENLTPATERFGYHKNISYAVSGVLIIFMNCTVFICKSFPAFANKLSGGLIKTYFWMRWIIWLLVYMKHILHGTDKISPNFGNHP